MAKEDVEDNLSIKEITLSAECQPLTTIAGSVNVLSGNFFQIEQDLLGNTIDPLTFTRYYESSQSYQTFLGMGFGSQFPLLATDAQDVNHTIYGMISERDGFLIPYNGKRSNPDQAICKIDPRLLDKGYTNLCRVGMSGHANFVNWRAYYEKSSKKNRFKGTWTLKLGDGTQRLYQIGKPLEKKQRIELGFPTKNVYCLKEEIKPNGNKLRFTYTYGEGQPLLKSIETLNRNGQILNHLDLNHTSDQTILSSSCGNTISFANPTEPIKIQIHGNKFNLNKKILRQVVSKQNGISSYHYRCQESRYPLLTKVSKPNGRFVNIYYNSDDKVKYLEEPLGPNGTSVKTYSFHYEKDETLVTHANEQQTLYQFDKNHRLTCINYLNKPHIDKQEIFEWYNDQKRKGWLKYKSIQLGQHIYHLKKYEYDKKGNIIGETIYGNITGQKPDTFTYNQKQGTDSYKIQYRYSEDNLNLLIEKTTPEGITTFYSYLPNSNLRTHELHFYAGKIQERRFYSYDGNGQIKEMIEDNGSSSDPSYLQDVTYRRVKAFFAETDSNLASFGKPKKIIESTFDRSTSQMIVCKTTQISYDERARENKIRVIDSKNEEYEIVKEYDDRNLLIQQTDALGNTIQYAYDENHNKITEEWVGSGKKIVYEYDLGNRLVKKGEYFCQDIFETIYTYNLLNQLVAERDRYGHETTYVYDHLGRQIKCLKPFMHDVYGNLFQPSIEKEYNILNQVISKKDENGFITRWHYNIVGQPTSITYPDHSIEQFEYDVFGRLKHKWNTDGTSIMYTHDPKGHVLTEQFLDKSGAVLKTDHYEYKGPLLHKKIDAMGVEIVYEYDGAGRKVAEITARTKTVRYQYDDFGRLTQIYRSLNDNLGQFEHIKYDWLDRPISKILKDDQGIIYLREEYEYDRFGNQTKKTIWQSEDKKAIYLSLFDVEGNLLWQIDPLENKTEYRINHNAKNTLNQRVRLTTILDPLLRPAHQLEDVYHRLIKKEFALNDRQMSCTLYSYDGVGHLAKQEALVMADGQTLRNYSVHRKYNSRGWLESEEELPDGKMTQYRYDEMGRRTHKLKPDGIHLTYSYDGLGRLKQIKSSDQTISYSYCYDLHDNPIEIIDEVHGITRQRKYDLFSRLIRDELSPGIFIEYDYDNLDRIVKMSLPDRSYVTYEYNPFRLKKIKRYNSSGEKEYELECAYDNNGNLLQVTSPAGVTYCNYDLFGRPISIRNAKWESHLEKFDPLGNLLILRQICPNGDKCEQFVYDRFDHLISESDIEYRYDSLGNCVGKNGQLYDVNTLNQLKCDEKSIYQYDLNGNLISQTQPDRTYKYDALNRMILCEQEGNVTSFMYDAFGRCLQVNDQISVQQLLYKHDQEIGSMRNGELCEFRLTHPENEVEKTFAIELQNESYFPIQDHRCNICALQRKDGSLAQWSSYSAFGRCTVNQDSDQALSNPWSFANKREIVGLSLFTHRFYNPQMMRWQTTDPLGFEDGLNLYKYIRNNPHRYFDRDGRFAFLIPFITIAFGSTTAVLSAPTLSAIAGIVVGSLAGVAVYQIDKAYENNQSNLDNTDEEENVFPDNPDDLLPDLERDKKGRIHPAENIRIRPEKHNWKDGDTYNPRHHGQHYHIETRKDPTGNWGKRNIEKLKPQGYDHGRGTGYLPGEPFPGE